MWDYRFRRASGTTVKDKSSSESLSQGQFLAFERPDMIYYTTSPQNTPLRAPKLPDSYFNIAIMKDSDTKSYRDSVKNFDFGRSSHPKSAQESNRSFRDKRTQPNTSYNHFSARAS